MQSQTHPKFMVAQVKQKTKISSLFHLECVALRAPIARTRSRSQLFLARILIATIQVSLARIETSLTLKMNANIFTVHK